MFLFWYYIHIPIKNIMCLRGIGKRKILRNWKLSKKEKEKISVGSFSRGCRNPHTARLYQTDCWIPNLTFFHQFFWRGDCGRLFPNENDSHSHLAALARRVPNCSAETQYMSANLRQVPGVLVFLCFC